jgi:hypothetical protein
MKESIISKILTAVMTETKTSTYSAARTRETMTLTAALMKEQMMLTAVLVTETMGFPSGWEKTKSCFMRMKLWLLYEEVEGFYVYSPTGLASQGAGEQSSSLFPAL